MLVKYREELTRPIQEALDFMRRIEAQLNMLSNSPVRIFNSGTFFLFFLPFPHAFVYIDIPEDDAAPALALCFAFLCSMPSLPEKGNSRMEQKFYRRCREGIIVLL